MNTSEQEAKSQRAYQHAMEIIRQEWLAAGKTQEELDQEDQILAIYEEMLASGRDPEEIHADWDNKSNVEIICEYQALTRNPTAQTAQEDDLTARIEQGRKSNKLALETLTEMRR
jgi:hypothetical protein